MIDQHLTRRKIIKLLFTYCAASVVFFSRTKLGLRLAFAEWKRKVVRKGTPMESLMHENPAKLDTSLLETTPASEFDVMGETTYIADMEKWRLQVEGAVRRSLSLRYEELLARPNIEKNALLICSGFFAYNGLWKGVSIAGLLKEAGLEPEVTHIKISGSEGFRRKTRKFKIDEVMNDKLFLAYSVNGQVLPERHGFPLRLVAEDHKGARWVKYVNRIIAVD